MLQDFAGKRENELYLDDDNTHVRPSGGNTCVKNREDPLKLFVLIRQNSGQQDALLCI